MFGKNPYAILNCFHARTIPVIHTSMFGIKTALVNQVSRLRGGSELTQVRIFPMGYICNHACPMCWREFLTPEKRKELTKAFTTTDLQFDDYMKIITTLPRSVERVVLCGGGEPLLFPKIADLLEAIKKKGKEGHVITNGTKLTPDLADRLIACKWDALFISVNAATKGVYTLINGVDSYDLVLQNIKYLVANRKNRTGPKIGMSLCVQKGNYREIIPFFEMGIALGIDEVFLGPLSPYDLTLKQRSALALDNKERLETLGILEKAKKLLKKAPHLENNIDKVMRVYTEHPNFNFINPNPHYWHVRHCDLVQHSVDISPDGDIKPCGYGYQLEEDFHLDMNIKDSNIQSIWRTEKYKDFRKRLDRGDFYPACHKYCTFFIAQKQAKSTENSIYSIARDMAEKTNHHMA